MEELEKRLRGRGTEKEEDIVKRLGNAQKEMDYGAGEGNFDCVLVWVLFTCNVVSDVHFDQILISSALPLIFA